MQRCARTAVRAASCGVTSCCKRLPLLRDVAANEHLTLGALYLYSRAGLQDSDGRQQQMHTLAAALTSRLVN